MRRKQAGNQIQQTDKKADLNVVLPMPTLPVWLAAADELQSGLFPLPGASQHPIPPRRGGEIGYQQETPPAATMSCPRPYLGPTSMDACNPALLIQPFGLCKTPPWRDIDVIGLQQGHLALPLCWTVLRNQGQCAHRAHRAEAVFMK